MTHFVIDINKHLNSQLQIIDLEESDFIRKAQELILYMKDALTQL